MKKIKYIILIMMLIFIPNVSASSIDVKFGGNNSVKVGNTASVYVNLSSSDLIKGVDITYKTTGNISVTGVNIGPGLTKMGQDGNRYILYSNNGIKSGSTILTFNIRGTKEGSGTLTITKVEATVSNQTVAGTSKSFVVKVNPLKTQAEIDAEKKAEEEALKKEQEAALEEAKKEEERKKQLEEANKLVGIAENTNLEDDYNNALASVNKLPSSDDKQSLLNRLNEVRFKIELKKECSNNTNECNCPQTDKSWIIMSIVLLGFLILESAYIVYILQNKRR